MESAAGSSGAALLYPDTTRKRRRSQSPPPAGERSTERKFSKLRGGGGGAAAVWENLDLLLSLQGKDSSLQRKIELAFNFLTTESNQSNHGDRAHSIQLLRAVSFIGNWVQPILPKNSKKMSEPFDPALDYRCWVILRVCIEKKPSLSISPNLLKSLTHVVRHAFIRVNTGASCDNDEPFRLFEQVSDCISLLFSSNTRAFFNAGVDLWASCAIEAVNLAQKVSTNEKNGCHEGFALRKLGVCLLEQFSSFLRFYANPKNMFRVFVDRVLDSLLELLVLLHSQANSGNHKQSRTILKIVEDILSNGLFHPQHISGYFGLKNLNKRSEAKDVKGSYHRHLFNRFKGIKAENKAVLLAGFGYLLQLFVSRVRNQRTSFALKGTTFNSLLRSNEASEESQDCRKPLFEVFMQFIEVLVLECRGYSQKDFSNLGVTRLVEIHCMLKSMNDVLTTLIKEKIYLPTEDTLEGSYFKFLQEIYNMLISIADKIYQFWISTSHVQDAIIKMLPLISTEIIIAAGYFLEIEYKVMGDDLVQLWLMIFALSAINSSSEDVKPCLLLASKIAKLSSQVICTFSELRQVTYSIFRLCDAVRIFGSVDADVVSNSFSVASLSSQKCLESLTTLLSSQILRDAIFNSIYSMPEGQSSRCIEELTLDITHTLKWIKACSFEDDDLKSQGKSTSINRVPVVGQKAELVGRHLSELYIAVLDSVTVTASNSTLVGKSVERLLNSIRPSFSHLVQNKPSNLNESIFSFIGNFIPSNQHEDCQKNPSWSWVFVFFFRLYISCRSLYRQCVSLMPPELAIEASESMGNLFIVCSGKEWTNAANILTEGYFAWIVESSNSLLDVIKALSESLSRNHDGYALLVYVLHMMALQRLNDLDRQIKAFNFLLEDDTQQFDRENRGNPGLFKESCTYEAAQLTSFMMGYMRLLFSGEKDSFQGDEIRCASQHFLHNSATWDLSLCSLDEGSLPVATWRLLCENIDIWRSYASKKDLKNFFSNLINFSFVQKRSCKHKDENVASQTLYRKQTLHNVSLKLLHDTIIYDQKVLSKNLASSFCHVLKNLVSSFVNNTYGVNALLDSLPDLSEAFHNLENKQLVNTDVDATRLHSLDELQICENLLDFFSTVPGIHAHSKPFLQFLTYILHLERFLLAKLLNGCNGSSTGNPTELLQLFLSCRRAMQNLIFSLSEECPQSKLYSAFSKFFGNSSCLIWLLRSVQEVVDLSHKIFVENTDQVKCIMLSLVDKTAQIFSTLANMNSVFFLRADKKQVAPNGSPDEGNASQNGGQTFDILENSALKCVQIMAGLLENSTSSIPVTIKDCKHTIKVGNCCDILCWDKILCIMSCIQGFLWGLISALESTIKDYSAASPQERKVTLQYASRFSKYIVKFEAFVDLCLYILFVEDHGPVSSISVHLPQEVSCENGFLKFDALVDEWSKHRNCEVGMPHVHHAEAEVEDINRSTLYPSDDNEHLDCCSLEASQLKDNESIVHSNDPASVLSETCGLDLFTVQSLKGFLLKRLLNGERPLVAFTLRELFKVSAAILKLKCMLSFPSDFNTQMCSSFRQLSLGTLVGTTYIVLQKIADLSKWPDAFTLVWIDGILRYLEVLGSYFILPELNMPKELYAQIINAHLRAIGKCISLQGKNATLPTHEIGSSTKTFDLQNTVGHDVTVDIIDRQNRLNSFKSRLRMSLRNFVEVASNAHLNTALQVMERALVGVNQHSHSIYEVDTGNLDGGTVSCAVAAGIDCLYLVLESVSGNKRVVKRTVPGLVAALFNIVLHLQGPFVFYKKKLPHQYCVLQPDAGAVVLMCVEVITAFVGKHSFQMDGCHVSQCLHIPVALFKGFKHHLASHTVFHSSAIQVVGQHSDGHEYIIDRQFSVDMYTACCKLLCATLRHQQREAGRCVAVLEDSVNILLGCLESPDTKLVTMEGYFAWNMQESIKCASFFRRIYEEMRQQQDFLGRHSLHFLAGYITMFSGQGPLQTGITREIDEALRPGVYSLIDICEESDFQQLHTYLGEGPCRTTLADLVHDYKLHFQYQGKI